MPKLTPRQKGQARSLRRRMTKTELLLWQRLRNEKVGFHFRRQHPWGPYTLDFFCYEVMLCVEIDGVAHEGREERDAQRDAFLTQASITTMRIASKDVAESPDEVVASIRDRCIARSGRVPEPEETGEAGGEAQNCESD